MKITTTKVKKILERDYGWSNLNNEETKWITDEVIKDTIKVIDSILKFHKGISIKK